MWMLEHWKSLGEVASLEFRLWGVAGAAPWMVKEGALALLA
jgi:hypothetical protein